MVLRSVDAAVARQDGRHAGEAVAEEQRLYCRDRFAIGGRDRRGRIVGPQTVERSDPTTHKRTCSLTYRQLSVTDFDRFRVKSAGVEDHIIGA